MREDLVVMLLDLRLTVLGVRHHRAADGDVGCAEEEQDTGHPPVERQRRGDQQQQRHRSRQMLAHEFEPQREQRFHRAQQRVKRMRGAVAMMPRQRHGDHLLEGLAQHVHASLVRKPVCAARDENERNDVEGSETGPRADLQRDVLFLRDGLDDAAEQNGLSDHRDRERHIGKADDCHPLPFGGEVAHGPPVD